MAARTLAAADARKDGTTALTMRLNQLNAAIAETNAPLRFKGPGPMKLAGLIVLELLHSIFRSW